MQTADTLKCISDLQRLRILNLLEAGPLCVCHLQEILAASQVQISKQLATMKPLDLIEATRQGTWRIYELKEPLNGLLRANLEYLREGDCEERKILTADLKAREKLVKRLNTRPSGCPPPVCESIGCC